MNKKIKTRWVAALRSKKYTQGYDQLETEDGSMCCLGVLAAETGTARRWRQSNLMLTKKKLQKCGLSLEIARKLASKNDSRRVSFARIATWIEKNL